jgi:hypothetical protein
MKGERGRARPAMIFLMLFSLAGATAHAAEDTRPPQEAAAQPREGNLLPCSCCNEGQWQFLFSPYLWIPGMNLDITLGGHTAGISAQWWDMAAKLFTDAIGGMGRFEAWKGRWGFFLDSYFIYLQGSETDGAGQTMTAGPPWQPRTLALSGDLGYIVRAGKVDVGLRYLLGTLPLRAEKPLPVLSFEALGGGRFAWYNQDIRFGVNATFTGGVLDPAGGKSFSSGLDREYGEPFLGARVGCWVTRRAIVLFRGTVGGFGIVSDHNLDSDLELNFGYRVHRNVYAYLGYRALYEQADQGQISISGWFHGPVLGTTFVF